jgi:hypothetical protein
MVRVLNFKPKATFSRLDLTSNSRPSPASRSLLQDRTDLLGLDVYFVSEAEKTPLYGCSVGLIAFPFLQNNRIPVYP